MKIFNNITELVGKTPMLSLGNFAKSNNLKAQIIAKLEYFNPAGSVKDRVALAMINKAEQEGKINKDTVIIEPTSGNTGIGLASVCASRGYKMILTMPETMSLERRALIKAYGAQIELTSADLGMKGAIEKANMLASQIDNSFIPGQFDNPQNPQAHIDTTGPEIWDDTDGKIDVFVACVGTGGTLTGVGKYLKSQNPQIEVVAVEPQGSPMLSQGVAGPHKIQGIGAGFIPKILDTEVYDKVITISDEEAYQTANEIAKSEGFLVGISSGAAVCAAKKLAQNDEYKGKNIVVILPDTGERYLSSNLFD